MKRSYLLILLLFCLSPALVWAQGAWVVDPGEGVGAITVGMSSSAADTVLKATRVFGGSRSPDLVEYGKNLVIQYEGNKAVLISLHANSIKTKSGTVVWTPYKGAKIGASWSKVASLLPAQKLSHQLPTAKGHPREHYYAYSQLGIGFRVKGASIVQILSLIHI